MGLGQCGFSSTLLACFVAECEQQLSFFETINCKRDLARPRSLCGLVEIKDGRQLISPLTEDTVITKPFFAAQRFEWNDLALEITYGDSDFIFDIWLHKYPDQRYYLSDILRAAQKNPRKAKAKRKLTSKNALRRAVRDTVKLITQNYDLIINPPAEILKRAAKIHQSRIETKMKRLAAQKLESASLKAARAFIKQDYKAVIYWLRPFQDFLDKTDSKKLEIAKERFLEFA